MQPHYVLAITELDKEEVARRLETPPSLVSEEGTDCSCEIIWDKEIANCPSLQDTPPVSDTRNSPLLKLAKEENLRIRSILQQNLKDKGLTLADIRNSSEYRKAILMNLGCSGISTWDSVISARHEWLIMASAMEMLEDMP